LGEDQVLRFAKRTMQDLTLALYKKWRLFFRLFGKTSESFSVGAATCYDLLGHTTTKLIHI